jgi:hypothetical protein
LQSSQEINQSAADAADCAAFSTIDKEIQNSKLNPSRRRTHARLTDREHLK